MLTRLTGTLEAADDALILAIGPGAVRVDAPRYLLDRMGDMVGRPVTVHTRLDLESHNQGTSFSPRLIGFGSPEERAFFELFTSVKGLGARRALRALAHEPATIAAWIVGKDARALQQLPEIGKRLAETVIAELSGKVDRFATEIAVHAAFGAGIGSIEPSTLPPGAREALEALVALGETRPDAERKVRVAMSRAGADADANDLIGTVFGGV